MKQTNDIFGVVVVALLADHLQRTQVHIQSSAMFVAHLFTLLLKDKTEAGNGLFKATNKCSFCTLTVEGRNRLKTEVENGSFKETNKWSFLFLASVSRPLLISETLQTRLNLEDNSCDQMRFEQRTIGLSNG